MDGNFWLAKEDISMGTNTDVAQLKMKPKINMTWYHKTTGDNVVC